MKPALKLLPRTLWKAGRLLALSFLSFLLFHLSPVASSAPVSDGRLSWAAGLFFPVVFANWLWAGPFWAWAATCWGGVVIGMTALASRQSALFWIPLELVGLGWVSKAGLARWQGRVRAGLLEEEHLEGELHTLEDELKHLQETHVGLEERLDRYRKLRHIANAFGGSLSFEDLVQRIVQETAEMVEGADLVLLYLVDPKTLLLELKSVWRRAGRVPIKAKRGDPFDLWVMRQVQPLLVQEPGADFRFAQVDPQEMGRPIGSLLAVPLVTEIRPQGVLRVESAVGHRLGSEELRLVRIVGDLTSLAIENSYLYQRTAELARTDDLTGLAVRDYFQKRLNEEIARAKGLQIPVSLLLIDIDHFKGYNDTFGHSAGDKLLKRLAQLLLQTRRAGEMVARLGGEEFVVLLPGVEIGEAVRRAEAIRRQAEESPVELRRFLTRSTVSVGVSAFPEDGWSTEALLRVADERLYRAKAQGRNRVC